ncbi:Hypp5699 [Branchiostoma lanceolatum]|uniref:Hypp5699 protein n=1 Tax=Branchiostoma lanceolatum TaxID=7740 RepID=A0A8J9VJP6_BRALA|nr:Hypp5699 [Branchiostoma lanceolatum]
MAYKRLIELRESYQSYRAPTPPPNPDTVDQAIQRLARETSNLRREASEDREVRRHRPQRPTLNNKTRYVRSSPTEEERDRVLDEHAERMYQRKMHLQMFGEDRSTSKPPSKQHSKTVRAPEKLQQIKQERLNSVPYNSEYQIHRMKLTTAMFGDDPTKKTSKTRREPAQDMVYFTVKDRQKQTNMDSVRTITKLPPLAPQRHHVTRKDTAADANTSASSMLRDPKPPAGAKSDISMAAHPYRQRLPRRRTKDARALKRRCDGQSGPRSKH